MELQSIDTPTTEAVLAKIALSHNAETGDYYMPDLRVVRWVGGAVKVVGRWDPPLEGAGVE